MFILVKTIVTTHFCCVPLQYFTQMVFNSKNDFHSFSRTVQLGTCSTFNFKTLVLSQWCYVVRVFFILECGSLKRKPTQIIEITGLYDTALTTTF